LHKIGENPLTLSIYEGLDFKAGRADLSQPPGKTTIKFGTDYLPQLMFYHLYPSKQRAPILTQFIFADLLTLVNLLLCSRPSHLRKGYNSKNWSNQGQETLPNATTLFLQNNVRLLQTEPFTR
jgi:hypothetical protein